MRRGASSFSLAGGPAVAGRIYGADDRVEWFELPDGVVKRESGRVVATLMDRSTLSLNSDDTWQVGAPSVGEALALCDDQRLQTQPSAGVCSGTLIAPSLVATAAHCVPSPRSCDGLAVLFEYGLDRTGNVPALPRGHVYDCARVVVLEDLSFPANVGQVIGVITSSVRVAAFFRETGTLPQGINFAVSTDLVLPRFPLPPAPPNVTPDPPVHEGPVCVARVQGNMYTAELRDENPFAYLTAVLRNEKLAAEHPADWLPWTTARR